MGHPPYNPLGMRVQGFCRLGAAVLAAGSSACEAPAPRESEVVVSAAISLKGPMEELTRRFQKDHRDTRIRLNFGSTGLLSSQIERGAPVDVLASASMRILDDLERQELLRPDSRRLLAGNRLVLIVPEGSKLSRSDWPDLASLRNLALGNPKTVPAGAYARECLESLGLWEELRPRLVFTEHVRQVLDYVAQSEVDAGLVYETDARILPDAVRIVAEAPESSHAPIRYGIALVAASRRPEEARAFIELATGAIGKKVLQLHGFTTPGS